MILSNIFYFIVTLGVLVLIHELGHFLAAKAFRMRVDRFSIGFPPRAFGKQIGETDYCVSWIPIGGYVKIAGMVDESFDTDQLDEEPKPWEFRSKPIWQRMIVISAGVIMNLILALVIFWFVQYSVGRNIWQTTTVGVVGESSAAATAGIHEGDRITDVNGEPVSDWQHMMETLYLEATRGDVTVGVDRGGQHLVLAVPRTIFPDPQSAPFGIAPENSAIVVGTIAPGKPADKLGLQPFDTLVAINGSVLRYDQQVRRLVKGSAGHEITVEWRHGAELRKGTVTVPSDSLIGIAFGTVYTGTVAHINYSLLESLPLGARAMWNMSVIFVQQIGQIITGKVEFSQSVGGPIKIAQMATQSSEMGAAAYFSFMALLSINLAVLNIAPFPVLDGGHLMLLAYEGITRKEVSTRVKLGIQKVGMFILLAFMAYVVVNDIIHF
jgi:regulator of sigma E protease